MRSHDRQRQFLGRRWVWATCLIVASCSSPLQHETDAPVPTFDYTSLPQRIASLDIGLVPWQSVETTRDANTLIVAQEENLYTVDIADPENPQLLSQAEWVKPILAIALASDAMYLVDEDGLHILAPEGPLMESRLSVQFVDGEAPTLLRIEEYMFLGTSVHENASLTILDIGNPTDPVVHSVVPMRGEVTDVAREGDLLAVGTEEGATLLDIADPTSVQVLAEINKGRSVMVANGFLYVNGNDRGSYGITALNITDPRTPLEIGSTLAPQGWGRMRLQGSKLFIRVGGHVEVLDISDRRRMLPLGSIAVEGSGWLDVQGELVWSVGRQVVAHRIGDSIEVPILGERGVQAWSWWDAQVDRGRLFAQGIRGFFSLSVTDPALPSPPEELASGYTGARLFRGERVYVYGSELLVEIRQLATGALLGRVDLSGMTTRRDDEIEQVQERAGKLYVLVASDVRVRYEFLVFDVQDASHPSFLGRVVRESDPWVRDVEMGLFDRFALVTYTTVESKADVIDIGGLQPEVLSTISMPSLSDRRTEHRGYIYYTANGGVMVVDFRDPLAPRVLGLYDMPRGAMVVRRNVLYVMTGGELSLWDVSFPESPEFIATRGNLSTNWGRSLLAGENVLYGLMENGVLVLPLHSRRSH